ncbi:MAG: hypothetical protein MUO82_00505, partial [Candidatus Thermoplasmatota archaeon]|nr:hypothetical protein [Candidatus Thermoplasmatota archaeon]
MYKKIIGILICTLFIGTSFMNCIGGNQLNQNKVVSEKITLNNDVNQEEINENSVPKEEITLSQKIEILKSYNSVPLYFTKNIGQYPDEILFQTQADGATVYLCRDKIVTVFHSPVVNNISLDEKDMLNPDLNFHEEQVRYNSSYIETYFVGADPEASVSGEGLLSHYNNYFIGNDSSKWYTDVPNYKSVYFTSIYPGIDLKYYNMNNTLKYDFIVHPGGDPLLIQIKYSRIDQLNLSKNGDLNIKNNFINIVEKKPVIYQIIDEKKYIVDGEYNIKDNNTFNFKINSYYNISSLLIIDPELIYSTYLGGESDDFNRMEISVDNSGCVYITGQTHS